MTAEVVHMRLGRERYAVDVGDVLQVVPLGDVAPVPGAPASVLGLRNLHGRVVPIVDLAAILGIDSGGRPANALIVDQEARTAGLAVDEVLEVGPLNGEREPAESPLLQGTVTHAGTLVGLLDVGRVLDRVGGAQR